MDGLSASRTPRAGQLLALGKDGQYPASVLPAGPGGGGGTGAAGTPGASGTAGAKGDKGDPGPSDGYYNNGGATILGSSENSPTVVATLTLPAAGSYVATGTLRVDSQNASLIELRCQLRLGGRRDEKDIYLGTSNPDDVDVLAFTTGDSIGSAGSAQVVCWQNGGTLSGVLASATITAVKVGSLSIG